ncbi:IclR family transcriptional regulator [Prauserella rugosa]|uniref:IclR family transcriptional regulator n=1 Tax=Prauserella rugosa TaxID=43354 RepID=A0A660CDA6_9PSEU|nr:IclR family transcriptional regulator [Prauserella rugosa]KID29862.1 transcriptional regulator, IclR family [Prauserella sp. Am3]KMS84499.1 IclR family transcriptional regulator [Streptomyces regensis]TWH18855.1 IclR family transcriptional regulator [Prauserella rugosa]
MAGNVSTPGATVVSRALAVLYAFDNGHRRLGVAEVARRTGLPAPTVHRLLRELAAGEALTRGDDGRYVIGRRLWDVGRLAPEQTELQQVASPFLSDIHAATRATVHLAVRDGMEVLYLDRLSGRASVPVVSRPGSRLPLHATGVGKVLLAHAPEQLRDAYLAADLRTPTVHTITQPGRLRRQLAAVRREGHATTEDEMTLGACSIAVPIVRTAPGAAGGSEVVAALGIVVPTLKRERTRLLTALHVAAQGIARSLP